MEASLVASSLEVNAEQNKHMAMPREENSGQNHNIKIGNKSSEMVERFSYLGTIVTNQNYVHEEIMSIYNPGNVRSYSMQNLLSSSLLS
jgi:hypothetical protein